MTKRTARKKLKRLWIGIAGGFVTLIGFILIPYPGPGWLVVFAGLAILATEFTWAQRVLDYAKGKYRQWEHWLKSQKPIVRFLIIAATGLIVVVTIYLLNVFGIINDFLNLNQDLLRSPFFS